VFGGERFHPERRLFNGTYLYDLASNVITDVGCSDAPSPRVRPGFAYDSKRGYFVLFGGAENQRSRLADLWRFLPRERVWERIDAANTPSARGGWYGMPYDPELDRFFLLCGRHDLSTFLDESWELELDDHAVGRATYVFDRETLPPGAQWRLDAKVPGDAAVLARFRSSDDGVHWSDWTGRFDDLTQRAGLVEVELTLRPGSHGEAPEVASLGFVA